MSAPSSYTMAEGYPANRYFAVKAVSQGSIVPLVMLIISINVFSVFISRSQFYKSIILNVNEEVEEGGKRKGGD